MRQRLGNPRPGAMLAGILACVACVWMTSSTWAAQEPKFTQEVPLYRPLEGTAARVDVGDLGFHLDCLIDFPYNYPEIFAFTDDEFRAACQQYARYRNYCEPVVRQPKDDKGLNCIDPFSAPDNKASLFAFRILIQNRGATPFDMRQVQIQLTLPDGKVVPAAMESGSAFSWLKQQEVRFQKERGMNLAQQAMHPAGFVSTLFYGYRFAAWDEINGPALVVPPGKTAWGLVVFMQETGADNVSVTLAGPGLSGAAGAPANPAIFPFRRVWKTVALDTKSKRWVEVGEAISTASRSTPRRPRTVLRLDSWSAKTEEDRKDLRHFLEKLVDQLRAVSRFDVEGFGAAQNLAAGRPADEPGHPYLCTGDLVTRSEQRKADDGRPLLHYEINVSGAVTDPETGASVVALSQECAVDDYQRGEDGQYNPSGQFTGRDIVLWDCAERLAGDLTREIGNAFPLRGTVITSEDGKELRIDLGLEDGVERHMKFSVLRPGGQVARVDGAGSVEKPASEIGEIEVTETGGNACAFKFVGLGKLPPQPGDLVSSKPQQESLLRKQTRWMNRATENIKKQTGTIDQLKGIIKQVK